MVWEGKDTKIRFSFVLLAAVLCLGAGAVLWKVQSSPEAAYWLAGASVVIPIMAPIFNKVLEQISSEEDPRLDTEAAALRKALVKQWRGEINQPGQRPIPAAGAVRGDAADRRHGRVEVDPHRREGSAIPIKGTFGDITEMFTRPGMPSGWWCLGSQARARA